MPFLSDKPAGGDDTGAQARDLTGLMDALGHERFSVVGHDTGFTISYALAADQPERVERVALAEIPGRPEPLPHLPEQSVQHRTLVGPAEQVQQVPRIPARGHAQTLSGSTTGD